MSGAARIRRAPRDHVASAAAAKEVRAARAKSKRRCEAFLGKHTTPKHAMIRSAVRVIWREIFPNGRALPLSRLPYARIARKAECSHKTVQRAVALMDSCGAVMVIEYGQIDADGNKQCTVVMANPVAMEGRGLLSRPTPGDRRAANLARVKEVLAKASKRARDADVTLASKTPQKSGVCDPSLGGLGVHPHQESMTAHAVAERSALAEPTSAGSSLRVAAGAAVAPAAAVTGAAPSPAEPPGGPSKDEGTVRSSVRCGSVESEPQGEPTLNLNQKKDPHLVDAERSASVASSAPAVGPAERDLHGVESRARDLPKSQEQIEPKPSVPLWQWTDDLSGIVVEGTKFGRFARATVDDAPDASEAVLALVNRTLRRHGAAPAAVVASDAHDAPDTGLAVVDIHMQCLHPTQSEIGWLRRYSSVSEARSAVIEQLLPVAVRQAWIDERDARA